MESVDIKKLIGLDRPKLKTAEFHRVHCPYCPIGYAEVMVERSAGQATIRGLKEPRRCEICGKLFMIKPSFTLRGVPLKDMEASDGR